MSILIFASVISSLPSEGIQIWETGGNFKAFVIALLGIAIIVSVVFMDQGQRRIPVQYAKRVVGRKMTAGGSTYLPLKVNQAGVIPIIFATSVMYFPTLLASITGSTSWVTRFVNENFNGADPNWVYMVSLGHVDRVLRVLLYGDPVRPGQTGGQPPKTGGFIPGIRPGAPTANYLNDILVRITLPGALFLAAIALIPTIVLVTWGLAQFPFGGTSVLIAVGVALETMKQIESQLLMRHYEGFLK